MIIVKVGDKEKVESAIKRFKTRFNSSGTLKELRNRQRYTKPSEKRREEIKKAIYKQKKKEYEDI